MFIFKETCDFNIYDVEITFSTRTKTFDKGFPQWLPCNPLNFRKFSGRREKSSAFFCFGSPHRPALGTQFPRPKKAEYVIEGGYVTTPRRAFAVVAHS